MNNFQLNNTSVYLGGQCKWDIVLSQINGKLTISGFQLTPISDNIPFNKRGDVAFLNEDHSYTLKKFCSELKENFWSYEPCLTNHIRDNHYKIIGYYDDSFVSGLKRSQTFQVYNKQYEYLQPLWLEKIEPDQHLRFRFNIYAINSHGNKNILDSKILDWNIIDNENINNEDTSFHNNFINYFNNWLKYLGICKGTSDKYGNDRVMYINLQNHIAQIEGVSTSSGQKSGKVSCDYVVNNLLSYERPNVETDYMLCSLFKNHNTITSQLFNINFCFNPQDVLDPFLVSQLKGRSIYIECDVSMVNDSIHSLDRRSIFTNYTFIQKDIYNPFIFMDDMENVSGSSGNLTGQFVKNYQINYKINGTPVDEDNANVLDYLRDPYIEDIKNINKITQPILHWGYTTHSRDTFNLYDGYRPYIVPDDNITRTPPETDDDPAIYDIGLYELKNINGVCVPTPDTAYTSKNGTLDWLFPKTILYFMDNDLTANEISDKFLATYQISDELQKSCKWSLSDSILNEYYEKSSVTNNDTITLLYLEHYDFNSGLISLITSFREWEFLCNNSDDSTFVFYNKNTNPSDPYYNYLLVSKDAGCFSLNNICNFTKGGRVSDDTDALDDFDGFIALIKNCSDKCNNLYDFYGFKQELEVGRDDLNKECYYKSLTKKTFLYRRCEKMTPYMVEDPSFNLNYEYYKCVDDNSIKRMYSDDFQYIFENKESGNGKILVLFDTLNFVVHKRTDDKETTIKKLIKEHLVDIYGINLESNDPKSPVLVDYIYNLYNINFVYEYEFEDSLDYIKYNIKMILK